MSKHLLVAFALTIIACLPAQAAPGCVKHHACPVSTEAPIRSRRATTAELLCCCKTTTGGDCCVRAERCGDKPRGCFCTSPSVPGHRFSFGFRLH